MIWLTDIKVHFIIYSFNKNYFSSFNYLIIYYYLTLDSIIKHGSNGGECNESTSIKNGPIT